VKVMHSASEDIAVLSHSGARRLANLFDTQIAAGFAGVGHGIGTGSGTDAIHLAQQVVNVPVGSGRMEYVIAGETNLMNFAELSNVEKLRRLFEAFTQQRDILHLLDQSLRAEGVQIFIGQESGYTILDDCSVVTAPYSLDQEVVGVLGVIGPTRMAYERVIPIVDITAKLLGSALNSRA